MKSTNYLIQEHKVILRALDVLDAMSAAVEKGLKADENDIDKILHFLRWFADGHHQAKEETILFPAMRAAALAQARPIEHMMVEHGQERAFVEQIEGDLRLGRILDFVSHASHLSSTLRTHMYKEDNILFETADQLLDAQTDEVLVDRLNRFDTPLDKESLGRSLHELRSLELKYLRK